MTKEVFKLLRVIAGHTQQSLASIANINRSFIGRVESGVAKPSKHLLSVLATELDVPVDNICSIDDSNDLVEWIKHDTKWRINEKCSNIRA